MHTYTHREQIHSGSFLNDGDAGGGETGCICGFVATFNNVQDTTFLLYKFFYTGKWQKENFE